MLKQFLLLETGYPILRYCVFGTSITWLFFSCHL